MHKLKYKQIGFTLLVLLVSGVHIAKAHLSLVDAKRAAFIKNGTTYVIMKNPNSADVAEIKEIITQGWTFTKGIEFITAEEIRKYPAPENTFMSLPAQVFNSTGSSSFTAAATRALSFFDLSIWQCDKKYFAVKRALEKKDRQEIAFISMSTNLATANSRQQEIDSWNWNLKGKVYNWWPGIIMNRLQDITHVKHENTKQGSLW